MRFSPGSQGAIFRIRTWPYLSGGKTIFQLIHLPEKEIFFENIVVVKKSKFYAQYKVLISELKTCRVDK